MLVIRPVTLDDLDQVFQLASSADLGLTTLPPDLDLLEKRISRSQDSFKRPLGEPEGEIYLLVLEDLKAGRIAGTSGMVSRVGGFEPFYAYQIETVIQESKSLEVRKEIQVLHLVQEHDGPCEIGTLFLSPDYRKSGNGSLLSKSRFLFMAEHPHAFASPVISELRGVSDQAGRAPFWEAVGRHFFDIDFPKADYLSMRNKQFIAELMPSHPIYIPTLPEEARTVIGRVHPRTEPAVKILEAEGFTFSNRVDIFDAGPIFSCPLERIKTARQSTKAQISDIGDQTISSEPFLIANTRWSEFRACAGSLKLNPDNSVQISRDVASALGVKAGDPLRFRSAARVKT